MKAVIVDIKDNVAAMLSEDGRVSKVKNKNYAIGQEIVLRNKNKYLKLAASAAAALMLFATPAWAYLTPYSYVSLDVNPSFEFSINRFDRVLEVKAVNDDGEAVVEKISVAELKNKEINEAVKNVLSELKTQGYIVEGKEGGVVVATSSKSKEKTDALSESLKISIEEEVKIKSDKNIEHTSNEEIIEAKKIEKPVEIESAETEEKNEKTIKFEEAKETKEEAKEEAKEDKQEIKKQEKLEEKDIKEKIKDVKEKIKEEKDKIKEETKEETKDKIKKETKDKSKESKEAAKEQQKAEKDIKKDGKVKVEVIEVSREDVNEAKEHNVTPGKWNLIGKLKEVYPKNQAFDEKEWVDRSVKDIMDAIKDYEKDIKEEKKSDKKEFKQDKKEERSNNKD